MVDFYSMPIQALLISCLALWLPPQEPSTVHFHGPGVEFEVGRPAGWRVDGRAAPQLAHFLILPEGENWRSSDRVIYARFVPIEAGKGLEEFLTEDRDKFEAECPFADDPLKEAGFDNLREFTFQSYHCPGVRHEMMAVQEIPRYFIVFLLTSPNRGAFEESLPSYRKVLENFRWWPSPGRPIRSQPD